MTITIVGHGYVGLVTACIFANFGNNVYVVGHTPKKIEKLKNGDPIIFEPGLQEVLKRNIKSERLHFTLDFNPAIKKSDIVFITVGTPPKKNGQADLSAVIKVAEKIGKNLGNKLTIVSCKSTVPVGTNKKVKEIIEKVKPENTKIEVASCPEFLKEGTALHDTLNPDRIVIGSQSKVAIKKLLELHKPLNGKRVITDLASAELIKYTSNAILATKISFANLISFYCEKAGANVEKVLNAVGLDKRIGRVFMNPGVGYGGSCLPKDVKALISIGDNLGIETGFLKKVDDINSQTRKNFLKKIIKNIKGKAVAIWGLSFKPNTDDIRFAPSVTIINYLLEKGFEITVYDPEAMENIKKLFVNKIEYTNNPYQTIKNKDALIILTEWNEFKQIDLNKVKKALKQPYIFDGRNIYSPKEMKKIGFKYYSVGREAIS